jgi:hypothetical protein
MCFSIFDFDKGKSKQIYLSGLETILKELFSLLGGPVKTSSLLNQKYSKTKEWLNGRSPISIFDLKLLLNLLPFSTQLKYRSIINQKDFLFSSRYSPRKVMFPKKLTCDLAYLVGILLGDGSLAGDSSNERGCWTISAFFDNREHQNIFDKIIENEFGIVPCFYDPKKGHTVSYICSKVVHQFLTNYFEMCNGFKCDKIFIPTRILQSNKKIICAFVQGLFDSDGTVTGRNVRYSTTSKKMSEQVQQLLSNYGIKNSLNVWIKQKKYLPLYTISIKSMQSKRLFYELINFRHPNKKLLLSNFIDSPIV